MIRNIPPEIWFLLIVHLIATFYTISRMVLCWRRGRRIQTLLVALGWCGFWGLVGLLLWPTFLDEFFRTNGSSQAAMIFMSISLRMAYEAPLLGLIIAVLWPVRPRRMEGGD